MNVPRIKILLSIILLAAYGVPLLVSKSTESYEYSFIDMFYGIGTTLGIGFYLMIDSCKLKLHYENYLFSAGVFFVGLSLVFILDLILYRDFRTYWYVMFNFLTALICYLSLTYLTWRR